jgi:serine/threonine protein kinase
MEDEICKMKFIPPLTDLKKISILTDFQKQVKENYPKSGKFTLYYDGDDVSKMIEIGRGTNGIVFLFIWKGVSAVMKYPLTHAMVEPYTIDYVLEGYHHHIIPYRLIFDQWENPFVVMQEANGDLYSLFLEKKLNEKVIRRIISFFVNAIDELWRKDLVYTDMKKENLLYQCHKDGTSFFFGDIGSFAKKGAESYDFDVEPPECKGIIDKNFALFTIGLLIINIYDLSYTRPDHRLSGKKKETNYKSKFLSPLLPHINKHIKSSNLRRITRGLLEWDSKDRDKWQVGEIAYLIRKEI